MISILRAINLSLDSKREKRKEKRVQFEEEGSK